MTELWIIPAVLGYFALATVFYGLLARFGVKTSYKGFYERFALWVIWPVAFIYTVILLMVLSLWEISSGGKE